MPYHIIELGIQPNALKQLREYQLLKQWRKAERYILADLLEAVDFKKRRPYTEGAWQQVFYFRLSQKYRALGAFNPDNPHEFTVTHIDDHQ